MSFYLNENSGSTYISDSYLRYKLLNNEKMPTMAASSIDASESLLYKKLDIKIPVISPNDFIEMFNGYLKKFNIDDYSLILNLNRTHLLSLFYLLFENKITEVEFNKILFASSYQSRNDTLLSYLNGNDKGINDIFGPLKNMIKRMAGFKNQYEIHETGMNADQIKSTMSKMKMEIEVSGYNVGNLYYSRSAPLYKRCIERINTNNGYINPWNFNGGWNANANRLAFLSHISTADEFEANVRSFALSDWDRNWIVMVMIFMNFMSNTATRVLLLLMFLFPGIATFGFGKIILLITAAIAIGTAVSDASIIAIPIGFARWFNGSGLLASFMADKRFMRLDQVKTDVLSRLMFEKADFEFNNRLNASKPNFELKESHVDSLVTTAFGENWYFPNANHSLSQNIYNRRRLLNRNGDTQTDWYQNVNTVVNGNGVGSFNYTKTSDTSPVSGKTYYKKTASGYVAVADFSSDEGPFYEYQVLDETGSYVLNSSTFEIFTSGEEEANDLTDEEKKYLMTQLDRFTNVSKKSEDALNNDKLVRNFMKFNDNFFNIFSLGNTTTTVREMFTNISGGMTDFLFNKFIPGMSTSELSYYQNIYTNGNNYKLKKGAAIYKSSGFIEDPNFKSIMQNDILITDTKDSSNIHGRYVINNFGTLPIIEVLDIMTEYILDDPHFTSLNALELANNKEPLRAMKAFIETKFGETFRNTQIRDSRARDLVPLVKSILLKYLDYLLDDEKFTEVDDIVYAISVSEWYYKYYTLSFYVRHSAFNLVKLNERLQSNSLCKSMTINPCQDSAGIKAMHDWIDRFRIKSNSNKTLRTFGRGVYTSNVVDTIDRMSTTICRMN